MKIITLIKTTAILAVMAIAGCANIPNKYAQATGQVSQDLNVAHADLVDIGHKVTGTPVQGEVEATDMVVSDAIRKVPVLEQGAADDAKVNATYQAEIKRWPSFRQRHEFWTIVGFGAAGLLLFAVITILSNTSGPVGMIAGGVFNVVTLGVHKFFSSVGTKIQAGEAALSSKISPQPAAKYPPSIHGAAPTSASAAK